MISLQHELIKKNGRNYAVIPYAQFLKLREELEDAADLRELRTAIAEAKANNEQPISIEEARVLLNCPRKKHRGNSPIVK